MRHRYNIISIVGLTLLLGLFQNCSPYKINSNDKSTSAQSGSSAPPPRTGTKTVFMANGHVGRTVMSCDDGVTWINDRSDNDATRCWVTGDPNYLECDHTPTSGHGIDAGEGWFFANFGWGFNGSLRKTRDGVNWTMVRTDGWGPGIAYGKNVLLLAWGGWASSLDLGSTWIALTTNPATGYDHPDLKRVGNLFVVTGGLGGLRVSSDFGATWDTATSFLEEWGGHYALGNGVLVSVGTLTTTVAASPNIGYSARSYDNGKTWTAQQLFSQNYASWSGLVFDGKQFVAWGAGQTYKSSDGVTWTSTPMVSAAAFAGPVAFNPETGTYVAIPSIWGHYYADQKALRSTDGVTWTALDADHFKGGHPLSTITVGVMDASACP